jgi:hypothetical protein
MFLIVNSDISNSVNQLASVVVNCCVLFEVRNEFLNIIKRSDGFNLTQTL